MKCCADSRSLVSTSWNEWVNLIDHKPGSCIRDSSQSMTLVSSITQWIWRAEESVWRVTNAICTSVSRWTFAPMRIDPCCRPAFIQSRNLNPGGCGKAIRFLLPHFLIHIACLANCLYLVSHDCTCSSSATFTRLKLLRSSTGTESFKEWSRQADHISSKRSISGLAR